MSDFKIEVSQPPSGTAYALPVTGCSVHRTLNNAVSTMEFKLKDVKTNLGLYNVELKQGASTLFRGTIKTDKIDYKGVNLDIASLQAFDNLDKFNRRIVAEIFLPTGTPYNVRDILITILTKYTSGITFNGVKQFSATIDEIIFDYEPLLRCVQRLANIAGCYFYIDRDNDFHFFADNDGTISTAFNESNIMTRGFNIEYNNTEIANRVWIIGAKQAASNYTEEIYSYDGENRVFKIGYSPTSMEAFEWSGSAWVSKTIEQEKNYDGTEYFLYNKDEKNVTIPPHRNVPASGKFKVKYKALIQIMDMYEDALSQGIYGLYEIAIKSADIKTKAEARKIARQTLKTRSKNIITVQFSTTDWNSPAIGKLVPIKLAAYNLDTKMLLVEKTTNFEFDTNLSWCTCTLQGVV
jgi:hypothetical protein